MFRDNIIYGLIGAAVVLLAVLILYLIKRHKMRPLPMDEMEGHDFEYYCADLLKDNGFLLFEIGYDELESIKKIFSNYKEYEILESVKDLAGNDRVIICRFHQI